MQPTEQVKWKASDVYSDIQCLKNHAKGTNKLVLLTGLLLLIHIEKQRSSSLAFKGQVQRTLKMPSCQNNISGKQAEWVKIKSCNF